MTTGQGNVRGVVLSRWLAGLCIGGLLLTSLPSSAQTSVKPYVMLLVDTSTSMIWDLCHSWATNPPSPNSYINGDNSSECPGNQISCSTCNSYGCGNGIADDSRLYKVKKGAYNVVSAFGEVTWGLSRYRQVPATFTCNATANGRAGGWQYEDLCPSGTAMGSGGNQADVLVSFSANNQDTILRWMNNCDDYPTPGACPGTTAPTTGCSLCTDCGSGCDMEIRGAGNTPIAGSLYDLRVNFFPSVIAGDTKSACRPYKVILLTDGIDTCPGNPITQAAALFKLSTKSIPVHVVGFGSSSLKPNLDSIAKAGGTTSAVVVDNEVSLALAMAKIISESLLKESCNNADDDCNGLCDETWPEVAVTGAACTNKHAAQTCSAGVGICLRTGLYVCKSDGSGSQCNVSAGPPNSGGEICNNNLDDDCDGAVDEGCLPCVKQPEICNGKDDDCDGSVDEGYVSAACGSNIGECKQGTTACVGGKVVCNGATPPSNELCDNKDNNCDTIVDKFSELCYPPTTGCNTSTGVCLGVCQVGSRLCTNGTWGVCLGYKGPTTEACNGLDDDCDGQTDEGVSNTCTNYATCASYITCSACLTAPAEICDGKDNDCNGTIDDNPLLPGTACGAAIGECKKGTWACVSGALVCQGGTGPTQEICDGKDNDCNGKIDDSVSGLGGTCGTNVGECKPGTYQCVGGKVACVGGTGPTKEICDGKDNDCDGQKDEMAECPGSSVCVEGKCLVPCKPGEFVCPGGTKCVNGYCIPDACATVTCQETERCVNGACIAKCSGVVCESHEVCNPKTGQCVDDSCVSKGCPQGKVCAGYTCIDDPCPPGKCPQGQICTGGKCYDTCANVTCPAGQACVLGSCTSDPCAKFKCAAAHTCQLVNGKPQCVPDPCRLVSCVKGQVCHQGTCVSDPCASTNCPEGFQCVLTHDGRADCEETGSAIPTTNQMLATGAGGCACQLPDEGGAGGALIPLLFGLLWAVRRRCRRRRRPAGRLTLVALVALVALSSSACDQDPYEIISRSDGGKRDTGPSWFDATQGDDATRDAASEGGNADACVKTGVEVCDGKDNDCNGTIDDVSSTLLESDANNCGKCNTVCTFTNAFAKCAKGSCELDGCAPGYYDLDNDPTNGCEYQCLVTNGGTEACDNVDNDCNGTVDDGTTCTFINASGSCVAGKCTMGACATGHKDLNGQTADGCEYACPVWPTKTPDDCNGVDDDCDNAVDEDFTASACGISTGECTAGAEACIGGTVFCKGGTGPSAEICDNKDNDCDGSTDEDFDKQNDPRYCGSACVKCSVPHAIASCSAGVCGIAVCLTGWVDLDKVKTNGCEYSCTKTGVEICDGLDNDCNGKTDAADSGMVPLGGNPCAWLGECSGSSASCQGSNGWVCGYKSTVELKSCVSNADCSSASCSSSGVCPGELAQEETKCDDKDNDCDGLADEVFTAKGKACAEQGKQGICQGSGTQICNAAGNATTCNITTQGQTATNELCNGVDDDCDGKIDEESNDAAGQGVVDAMVHISRNGYNFYIYTFEASRPDASGTAAGSNSARACSKKSALPWGNVTYAQALAACTAAGKRLCTATEWYMACSGAQTSTSTYPWGNSYGSGNQCNGKDYYPAKDEVFATGTASTCISTDLVYDMSGNLKEWTNDPKPPTSPLGYTVRGGAYDTSFEGLKCANSFAVMPTTFYFPNLGFRCCSNSAP